VEVINASLHISREEQKIRFTELISLEGREQKKSLIEEIDLWQELVIIWNLQSGEEKEGKIVVTQLWLAGLENHDFFLEKFEPCFK